MISSIHTKQILLLITIVALFMASYLYLDQSTAIWLHHHMQSTISSDARFISNDFKAGTFYVPVVLLLGYCWLTKKRDTRLFYHCALLTWIYIVNAILCVSLKILFGRARPYELFSHHAYGFYFLKIHASFWSFPSGHTFVVSTFFSYIALTKPALRWWCLTAILLMCVARMIVAAHYLSDVFIGSVLGYWSCKIMIKRYQDHLPFSSKKLGLTDTPTQ